MMFANGLCDVNDCRPIETDPSRNRPQVLGYSEVRFDPERTIKADKRGRGR